MIMLGTGWSDIFIQDARFNFVRVLIVFGTKQKKFIRCDNLIKY